MNEHDTEKISGLLNEYGMVPAATMREADFILINTCSVREKASHKVFSRLGELRRLKEAKPSLMIGVVGCVAQQEGPAILKKAPFVDMVVGTHQYHVIPEILDRIFTPHQPGIHEKTDHIDESFRIRTDFIPDVFLTEIDPVARKTGFRAGVTIMEGCNKKCSYCIVPYTRGREKNRRSSTILREIDAALERGYTEIQLLGQTVTNYHDPEDATYSFASLLRDVSDRGRARRIRFVSPHPINFTDELIRLILERENICNHVHLPLQSGSNRILRKMRRMHSREWYLELVDKFRQGGRHVALSTDIITGFPGETEEDFEGTLDIVRKARYEQVFSFKYSVRPFTEASNWEDTVPDDEKSRRLMILQDLQKKIQMEDHQKLYLNKTFEILVEGKARDGVLTSGRTTTNKVVNFDSADDPGTYLQVIIERAGANSLYGKKINPGKIF